MNLVTLEHISHHYSERTLLDNVDLLINEGDRIGLIGPNGSGKTTFLRIVAGLETAVSGQRTVWGNVTIQYLPQEPELDDDLTVLETVFQSNDPQIQLLRQYEQVSHALQAEPHSTTLQAALMALTPQMDRLDGWAAEAKAKTILTKLGITQFDARVGTLSGGQRKRVALARGLITPTDLLILDEPTNHVDTDTVAWLEKHLLTMDAALLMVTHDRYFLDRVVNRIVELERQQLVSYAGNYGRYLEQRAARQAQLNTAEDKRQALLRQEMAWLNRGAQARSTKQKARIQRIEAMREQKTIRPDQRIAMSLASRRLGKRVLEATNLSKSYGDLTLFTDLDFFLNPGDRIGILGPNGTGKSTFLDLLAGKTAPDSGTITWGETVQLGYYDQQSEALVESQRVIDFIEAHASLIRTDSGEQVEAAQMLEWFLFPRPQQQAQVGSLSGGEKRRLYLLYVLMKQPNVLFLDEPTNDLDIQTLAVVEQFLDHFAGCLVVVSHDRYFLDRNVDFLMSLEDGLLGTRYPTPYEAYQQRLAEQTAVSPEAPSPTTITPPQSDPSSDRPRKLSFKERKELEALNEQIPQLESEISALETAVNTAGSDYHALQTAVDQLTIIKEKLEEAEFRWLELMEIAESS